MPSPHSLGDYLRARRELVQPGQVGIASSAGRRRVPGLRRSEVAALAGISTEYYVKLEQGQERNPTSQVLDSLSRALTLDPSARVYLHALARGTAPDHAPRALPNDPRTRWLIDSWPMTPAIVLDHSLDILAVNPLMSRLVPGYRVGGNALVSLLLDPELRTLHEDWEGLSARSIALLRSKIGLHPGHVRARQVVEQLKLGSERFRDVWNRYDVVGMTGGTHPLNHPIVGALSLHYAQYPIADTDDHSVFLYYAEPGSPSEAALANLAAGG